SGSETGRRGTGNVRGHQRVAAFGGEGDNALTSALPPAHESGPSVHVPCHQIRPRLPADYQAREPVAHEDDWDTSIAVVVVRHRVAVRARRRYCQQVADLGIRQLRTVDEDVATLAVSSDHGDCLEVRTVETADDAGFETLLEQSHLEVVTHA